MDQQELDAWKAGRDERLRAARAAQATHEAELLARCVPKTALKHGAYYRGTCRNASIARWNEEKQCFYHWRTKWGNRFVETIKHRADDDHYDVFDVETEITVPTEEIPFE